MRKPLRHCAGEGFGKPLGASGVRVDIAVIRSWLGHASIDATAHYTQVDIAAKRMAAG